jgi:MFS family permease
VSPRYPALAPFRSRSFRFQWPADLLTSWAFEMESLILGWYMLVETGSVLLLALFYSLGFVGTLISPAVGMAGDRIGHRRVLCLMRASYALLAAMLMTLAFAGAMSPLVVCVIAALAGVVRPSDLGMRSALIAESVPSEHLVAAMGTSRTTSDSARVAGALAGAGLFASLGMGWAYVVVVAFYAAGLLLTLGVSRRRRAAVPMRSGSDGKRSSPWRDLKVGIAYVWNTPNLQAAMWLAFLVNLNAFPLSHGLLPYIARDVYGLSQTGLGYLVACFASGALVGSVALSLGRISILPGRMMILFALAWYGLLLVFAFSHNPWLGGLLLMLAGCAQSLCLVPLAVMLLRTSAPELRGLVMGVRMLAIYSLPLGLLAAGSLIPRIGWTVTAACYALSGIVLTAAIGLAFRRHLWPLHAKANLP